MSAALYAELAALAAEEHQLVMDGRYEELAELAARREPLVAALPDVPPIEALGHLRQALELQELVTAQLIEARDRTAAEMRDTGRRVDVARGYGASTGIAPSTTGVVDHLG